MGTNTHFWSHLAQFFLEKEIFQTKSKHTFYVQFFFSQKNHAVYQLMWKNIVMPVRPYMTHVPCMLDT
jgi:hypothetical protein